MTRFMNQLDERRLAVFKSGMAMLESGWDEEAGMLCRKWRNSSFHPSRDTAFYALGLLLRDEPGDRERAARCINRVIDCQIVAPGEVFNGTFRSVLERPEPVRGKMNWENMSLETRYAIDTFYERIANAFRKRVQADEELKALAPQIEKQLQMGVLDEYPVVWATYDPNWREFVLSTFALILLYFEDRLPRETVARMDSCAHLGVAAAVGRAESRFTPLNTNIKSMHVFICDFFGVRWKDTALCEHATDYAAELLCEYRQHHSVPEFNSPTYNGVVHSYIGFWQMYGSNQEIRDMGRELEQGMWEDFAEVYNPAMKNICGPYSRAYELEMTIHTAVPTMLYINGILDEEPPLSFESDSNAVLVLSEYHIPEHVRPLLLQSRGERMVTHQYEELAERGDPHNNHALCTTTSWITDDMMLGCMRGSENSSHQLHPAVAFWRNAEGSLSTIKLLRRSAEGELKHFHTVYLDFTAEPKHMSGSIRMKAGRDIVPYFEIESPALDQAVFTDTGWEVCGLKVTVSAQKTLNAVTVPAPFRLDKVSETIVRVCYPAEDTSVLDFDLRFERTV